ncbi:MAG: pentapeptide repeat-containing protein [Microcystis sp. M54BS1]|uniref:pentapeptide repeat-containing protein n=1 Tax=unclassified Microcystis TaxID=2643300 RepID=UPI00257EDCE0|nr:MULTISPECIES: pentapeptide repeat-containing protein [unclassified Microcystis]MCA2540227.1 pentapeptide repeat-containing protein [Microcystis sp. M54BS1]MCA2595354.1 pentapeptide repeat-containing protein [Microcystis sp. M38BS1]MCA2609866.1 pentapeptide repeat-containing protein [Microcystis sp. M27BS1]MCA2504595.1 pentapeptide repeat-containing protein [Microcystis sp. M62BS1]MCA2510395.1 pentapeptide repeat-containing protein [Microcystis sp. M60BS1]
MMINELKMTEIKPLSWTELEMLVNDLKKKHTNKGLTDVETKILKGIFDDKKYADLAEEIRQEEQSIKNAAYDLFKILSEQTGEKIGKSNLITALARWYRDNSQTFDHNNKPQTQQSNKVLELVIEVGIDDLTPEKIDKINNLIQKIAKDNTIKPIMKLKGSIRLFLEGSEDGLQSLADLHQSGELQARLNELKSDDIPEIIVTKAEFTTDAKVIEKAELIKAIREGTIDKTTLRFVDLSGAILSGADLSGADLSEADLSGANLSGAILRKAILRKAILRRAILSEADLSGADLRMADLRGADLRGADLSWADLTMAYLSEADLSEAILSEADLSWAVLSEADLRRAILSEADLSGADLTMAYLRGADLRGANLSEADLIGANLSEAYLSGAVLSEADLGGANLRRANLSEAVLSEADLSWANLRRAILIEADLSEANLSGADVKNAIFIDATGITPEQKQDLIRRGAIFGDNSNDRSKVLV